MLGNVPCFLAIQCLVNIIFDCHVPYTLSKSQIGTLQPLDIYFQIKWLNVSFGVIFIDFMMWLNNIEISLHKMYVTLIVDTYGHDIIEGFHFDNQNYKRYDHENETCGRGAP